MRVGQARRRDGNERAIIEALRRVGCLVTPISETGLGDLLVWHASQGIGLVILEVKQRTGRLTVAQVRRGRQGWPTLVVRTVDEALALYVNGKAPCA